jgi:hypothetical protein
LKKIFFLLLLPDFFIISDQNQKMKIRRKVKNCLNCNALLDGVYNFCPMCGQENNDNNVSTQTLINDFFSNYFAFDSKLIRTAIPFFIKPGFITNRYLEGKRVSYAHPLRMYLIISLFYFFIWSLVAREEVKNSGNESLVQLEDETDIVDIIQFDSLQIEETRALLSEESLIKIDSQLATSDTVTFSQALKSTITPEEVRALNLKFSEEVLDTLTQMTRNETRDRFSNTDQDSVAEEESFFQRLIDSDLKDIADNRLLTDQQVLDSLKLGEITPFQTHITRQLIRISRAEKEAVVGSIVKNLPVMMLFLIPIFALILKLLYIRRNSLYIHHIIHGLHLHSFAYLLYGLTLILTYFIIESDSWSNGLNIVSFVLVTTYCYFSFLRVYRQGWFKTFVKFNMTGFIYVSLIATFLIVELAISMLMF